MVMEAEQRRMPKTCIQCGLENQDSALRCKCGQELLPSATVAAASTAAEAASPIPSRAGPTGVLAKVALVVAAIAFVPVFAKIPALTEIRPVYRALVGTGLFCASAVAAAWFLGRDRLRTLRVWRAAFLVWTALLLPVLLTLGFGLAREGWPRGNFNRGIAHLLVLLLVWAVPAYLTSICAMIRAYRWTAALALATGLTYLIEARYLLRATAPAQGLRLRFADVLDVILFGAQMASYLSIPVGAAFVVGAVMIVRAVRSP